MTSLDHPSIRKLVTTLQEAGMAGSADGIRILGDDVRTAVLAAQALGTEVGAIANSLVFRAVRDGRDEPLLVLTSGSHRADTDRLAVVTGADEVRMADPAFVREHTGHAIGGVAPTGHPHPLTTLVDRQLAQYEVVWAAGGHPKAIFPTTFADLVALTGGRPCEVE